MWVNNEIEELRKRIDRLEWLIGAVRDKETVDALKGSLADAQRKLEELLKKRNGELGCDALRFHPLALWVARLAEKSHDRAAAARAPRRPRRAAG
jgi:hypothetical protein